MIKELWETGENTATKKETGVKEIDQGMIIVTMARNNQGIN